MAKNLTLCAITEPVANANARGEGVTGGAEIQIVDGFSILPGVAQGYALREALTALVGADKMFRHHDVTSTPTGYGYGPDDKTLAEVEDLLKDPDFDRYVDSHLGFMLASKGSDSTTQRGGVKKAVAFSTTPYVGSRLMQLGHKADGDLVPTHNPMHVTRYGLRYPFNLEGFEKYPEHLYLYLLAIVGGFPVGGNQTSLSNLVRPAVVMWNVHRSLGGGLNPLGYLTEDVASDPDLGFFIKQAELHGTGFRACGQFTCPEDAPKEIKDGKGVPLTHAVEEMFTEAMALLGKDGKAAKAKAESMLQ